MAYTDFFFGRKFLFQPALPLVVVAALIRLGSKYEFRDILDFTVERLTFENPTTLEAYDGRIPYTLTRIEQYPGILFDIATLARENDIMSVLPCAFYRLLVTYTPVSCPLVSIFYSWPTFPRRCSCSMASRELMEPWLLSLKLTYVAAFWLVSNS